MSISLVAVFIPILLMGGIVGRLFREFAVTLSVGHRRLAGRLADHHADDVRQAAESQSTTKRARPALPRQRARLRLDAGPATRRACPGCCGTRGSPAARHARSPSRVNVYLYVIVPKGFFPQQDTGRLMGADPGRPGHRRSRRCAKAGAVRRHRHGGPGGGERRVGVHGGGGGGRAPTPGACSSR